MNLKQSKVIPIFLQQQPPIPEVQSLLKRSDSSSTSHATTETTSDEVPVAVVPSVPSTVDRPEASSFKISTTEEELEDKIVVLIPLAEGKVWSKKGKQVREETLFQLIAYFKIQLTAYESISINCNKLLLDIKKLATQVHGNYLYSFLRSFDESQLPYFVNEFSVKSDHFGWS